MKILLIEDEEPAAERLANIIKEIQPDAEIAGTIVSVKSAVKWFRENAMPELLIMDINLADGSSFEIFKEIKIMCPVIFTTAYDQYAIDAFKVNSIDYILKPVKKEELKAAFEKFMKLRAATVPDINSMISKLMGSKKEYQKRIIIRYGENIKLVEVKDVAYFYTEDKINFLCTFSNMRYPIDFNLDEVEHLVDPQEFFRINRQFIVNIVSIEKMLAWSKSRVKLMLKPSCDIETIVSTERSPLFKEWLTGTKSVE